MVRQLLLLNGLATLGVVTYHAASYGLSAMFQWTDRYLPVSAPNYDQLGTPAYFMLLTIRQLDSFVIPAFIFVSGFFVSLMAGSAEPSLKWSVAWARVRKFVTPFLIWTAIRYVLLGHFPATLHEVLRPYYFVVLLAQYYLLSPVLLLFVKRQWKLLLAVSAAIQFSVEVTLLTSTFEFPGSTTLSSLRGYFPMWFFPVRILWFTFGLTVGFFRMEVGDWLARKRWQLLTALVLLAPIMILEYQVLATVTGQEWLGPSFRGLSARLYAVVFVLCCLAFPGSRLPGAKLIQELGGKSLGVYLANIPVIYVAAVLMYHQAPWILGNQVLYQAILVFAGLAVPLLLMEVVAKSRLRWAYHHLFG